MAIGLLDGFHQNMKEFLFKRIVTSMFDRTSIFQPRNRPKFDVRYRTFNELAPYIKLPKYVNLGLYLTFTEEEIHELNIPDFWLNDINPHKLLVSDFFPQVNQYTEIVIMNTTPVAQLSDQEREIFERENGMSKYPLAHFPTVSDFVKHLFYTKGSFWPKNGGYEEEMLSIHSEFLPLTRVKAQLIFETMMTTGTDEENINYVSSDEE